MTKTKAFLLGMREFRMTFTTWIQHPDMKKPYDMGREFAHKATFRQFEPNREQRRSTLLSLLKSKD